MLSPFEQNFHGMRLADVSGGVSLPPPTIQYATASPPVLFPTKRAIRSADRHPSSQLRIQKVE